VATVNLGRIKPVFRGAYNNSTAYVIDDIVTSGNETFIAIAATQGNATTDASKWTKLAAKGADGTDVAAVLANKEIAFKTNAGALDGIPIGTAGQVLKVNSGATGYEFGADEGGGMDLVYSTDSLTSAVFNIDNVFTSTYKVYKMYIINAVPSNDAELQFNYRTGGASGAISNTANYRWVGTRNERNAGGNDSVASANHNWGQTYAILGQAGESGNTSKPFNCEATIYDPYNNTSTWMRAFTTMADNSGAYLVSYDNTVWYHQAGIYTGIAINCSAGSWSQGSVRIFGIKGS